MWGRHLLRFALSALTIVSSNCKPTGELTLPSSDFVLSNDNRGFFVIDMSLGGHIDVRLKDWKGEAMRHIPLSYSHGHAFATSNGNDVLVVLENDHPSVIGSLTLLFRRAQLKLYCSRQEIADTFVSITIIDRTFTLINANSCASVNFSQYDSEFLDHVADFEKAL